MNTQQEVMNLFDYKDGCLYWKVDSAKNVKAGSIAGYVNDKRIRVRIYGKNYLIHRLIFLMHYGYCPKYIDHIDGNSLNNRIDNLREATQSQNNFNSRIRIDNTSGAKGVRYNKQSNKWRVQIKVNSKERNFGSYDDLELAELVAIMAREKYHGEFARHV